MTCIFKNMKRRIYIISRTNLIGIFFLFLMAFKTISAEVTAPEILHSYLTHPLAYQGPTNSIPTILGRRENDTRITDKPSGLPLFCEFNGSLLMFEDYPAIREYNEHVRSIRASQNYTETDLEKLRPLLSVAFRHMTFALGLASQQGAYIEINRTQNTVKGQLIRVTQEIDYSDLSFQTPQLTSIVYSRVQKAPRARFAINVGLREVWETEIKDSHSYIFEYPRNGDPEADLLIGEIRVFENWTAQDELNGYSLFLIYNKSGFIIAFNYGYCNPPVS